MRSSSRRSAAPFCLPQPALSGTLRTAWTCQDWRVSDTTRNVMRGDTDRTIYGIIGPMDLASPCSDLPL